MHSVIKQRPAPQSPRYPLQTSGFSNTPTTLKRPPSLTELNELSIDKRNRLEGNSSGQRSRRMGLTATGTASAGEAEFKAETQTDDLATMSRTEQRQQAGRVKYLHSRGIECPNAVSYDAAFLLLAQNVELTDKAGAKREATLSIALSEAQKNLIDERKFRRVDAENVQNQLVAEDDVHRAYVECAEREKTVLKRERDELKRERDELKRERDKERNGRLQAEDDCDRLAQECYDKSSAMQRFSSTGRYSKSYRSRRC